VHIPPIIDAQGIALYNRDTDEFLYTWDMRQIVIVSKENSTHERITMFVAVCSFSPRNNFTLAIPIKTMPTNLSLKQNDETSFKARYKLNAIDETAKKQTDSASYERLKDELKNGAKWYSGGTLLTAPGVYVGIELLRELENPIIGEQPIINYGISSIGNSSYLHNIRTNESFCTVIENMTLGLTQSAVNESKKYSNYYAILLDAKPQPPILPGDFQVLQDYVPKTLADFIDFARTHPKIEKSKLEQLYTIYDRMILDENRQESPRLYQRMRDLINATYGNAKFNGFQIDILAPLDNGKLHFPLGIEMACPFPPRNTAVYVKVNDDSSFQSNISPNSEAYYGGAHYYIYIFKGKTPTSDISGKIINDPGRKSALMGAESSYNNAPIYALIILFLIFATLWLGTLFILQRKYNGKITKKDFIETMPYSIAFLTLMPLASSWVVSFGFFVIVSGSKRISENNRKVIEWNSIIFSALMIVLFILLII